jgi:hypothetical protein
MQPVDFHHIAVFEGGEQGVGWGGHGSQSLNGKDAMIAHHTAMIVPTQSVTNVR